MEPATLIALLAAVAGPTGVSLGWWLGRRGQREQLGRDERKSAYAAFLRGAIQFRNAGDEERSRIKEERWTALAELILVAPPSVVQLAAYWVSTGDRLLDTELTPVQRREVLGQLWVNHVEFIRLARTDLGIEADDPFAGFETRVGERLTFGPPPDEPAG